MQTYRLIAHPAHPPAAIRTVEARLGIAAHGWLQMRWRIEGSARLVVPPFARRQRADELWRTTCFELFCRPSGGTPYVELNLSPSERWAAYDFTASRTGMEQRPMRHHPVITPRGGRNVLILDAALRLADLPPRPWDLGISAVLEEENGELSYWALAHRADRPDFHDPACFAARVEPPVGP